ncbi:MAG: STAS/SEC14 domain-containing protein [Myxococcales bacterium]|nr:STAS/SEC14 domain-containing protein [Myxococcales bacterium]
MRVPSFAPDQQRRILQASAAILTEEGARPLSPTGAATLAALQRYVFRAGAPVEEVLAVIPDGLDACFVDEDQRQLGDTLLTVLPLIDEVPLPAKVAVSERALAAAGLPGRSRDMVRHFTENKRARVRLDVVRAVFGDRYRVGLLEALRISLKAAVGAADPAVRARYAPLRELPAETFGRELVRYWDDNQFGLPGDKGAMPEFLAASHDARHVLFNWDTTIRGEWGIGLNESGNMEPVLQSFVVASFINCQSGLRIAPESPAFLGTYDPDQFFRELERGAAAAPGLVEPDWDFHPLLTQPLEQVRAALAIKPGGNVAPGGPWCGPDGPPAARDQPLHQATVLKETGGGLVALRISGALTREDLAFFRELIELAAAQHERLDLLIELQRFSGWASPRSLLDDVRLFTRYARKLRRLAVLGDAGWQRWLITLDRPFAALLGIDERYFPLTERDAALAFCRGDTPA